MIKGDRVLIIEKETTNSLISQRHSSDDWVPHREGKAKEITEDDKFVKVKFWFFSGWYPMKGKNFSVVSVKKG